MGQISGRRRRGSSGESVRFPYYDPKDEISIETFSPYMVIDFPEPPIEDDWDWGEWGDAPPPWWDQDPVKPDNEEEDQRRSSNPVIRHCANCDGEYIHPNICILPDGNQINAFMYYKTERCI